jgi:hypothetical protein
MQPLNQLGSADDLRDVERCVGPMDAVREQRTIHAGRRTMLGKTDPHLPIFCIPQSGIERTDTFPRRPAHDHIRTATWNRIVSGEYDRHLLRRERWTAVDDVTVMRDVDGSGVDPVATCTRCRAELLCQLIGCPQIIIIDKTEPLADGHSDPAIPRRADAMRYLVPQHSNAGIAKPAEHGGGVVGRAFVDDDDLELDVLLAQYAAQRHRQKSAAIACRYDDGNPAEIHHLFSGVTDYLAGSR